MKLRVNPCDIVHSNGVCKRMQVVPVSISSEQYGSSNNSLLGCICGKCSHRIEALERSLENLKRLKILAKETYTSLSSRTPTKHTKNTSTTPNVSPDIVRARPKRPLSQRQLNFEGEQCMSMYIKLIVCLYYTL